MSLIARVVVLLLLAAGCAASAGAAETPSTVPSRPAEPLPAEAVRELVARLSDSEVRKLLIEHLDRGSAPLAAGAAPPTLGAMSEGAGVLRERAARIAAAMRELPTTLAGAFAKLGEPDPGMPSRTLGTVIAIVLGLAVVGELVWRWLTRAWRARNSTVHGDDFFADALRRAIGLLAELSNVVVFGIVALITLLSLWRGDPSRREFVLGLIAVLLLIRAVRVIVRFLLAPWKREARLLPLPDAAARSLAATVIAVVATYAVGVVTMLAIELAGIDATAIDAVKVVASTIVFVIVVVAIWAVRAPIRTLIRGAAPQGPVVTLVAELWSVAATLYVLVVFVARVHEILIGETGLSGAGILSLLVLVALPIVDYGLCRALAAAAAKAPAESSPTRSVLASYEPVLRRLIHIVVVVLGLLWLAQLWDLDLFAMAQQSLGGRVASSLLGIGLVLLLAYMLWDIARTAIDRRLAVETEKPADSPSSRLRTLLPLLRAMLLVTIAVMAVLSVLAALGVDILPLLAGASIVGVAIGFGSQSLVRDIVSGAFFLMDDAFRYGEYIEVGDAKGRIEKITLRSLFLRHHRGALNVLPYGEIKRLRNQSRDWMIMVLEFRLALDTDLAKVKKILKQIGEELKADEEYAPDLLQTLKSQGVMSTDENALVVRAKYTARPGDNAWVIRRVAYEKILKAFKAQGIEFATRHVAVYAPPGTDSGEHARLAAAAMAAEPMARTGS